MILTPGQSGPVRTFGPLALVDLVRYAGAANDFQPLHFDPEFARSAGFPGPIVHGMLSAGLLGTYLTEWLDGAVVRRFRVRFHQAVVLGEPLTASGRVLSVEGRGAEIELTLATPAGRAVTGAATVAFDSR